MKTLVLVSFLISAVLAEVIFEDRFDKGKTTLDFIFSTGFNYTYS